MRRGLAAVGLAVLVVVSVAATCPLNPLGRGREQRFPKWV